MRGRTTPTNHPGRQRFVLWQKDGPLTFCSDSLERGAAWSAQKSHKLQVVGSNPTAPTADHKSAMPCFNFLLVVSPSGDGPAWQGYQRQSVSLFVNTRKQPIRGWQPQDLDGLYAR